MVSIFSSEQKLTGGISFTMQFPMAIVKIMHCIALFICFVTKVIHIELVTDLTTQEFLGALRRFINRRGHPHNLYTANNELKELRNFLKKQETQNKIYTELRTNWSNNLSKKLRNSYNAMKRLLREINI
jgi:hypothetical protein